MEKLILLFLNILFLQLLYAQPGRYQEDLFDEVQVTYDITYSKNMDIIPLVTGVSNAPVSIDLKLDFYEPLGDSIEAERPLVLVFHDGIFLPPEINGRPYGTKSDSSCVEICMRLAKKGYVAASVEYRLGWNPIGPSYQDRSLGFVQAIYRAVQDGNTAIRFFRKNYTEDGNPYGINPDKITVWGNGSGGVISLNMAALSDLEEFQNEMQPPGKLLYDSDQDGTPDTPMIQENINGDIEGKQTTIIGQDIFFFSEGDTSNLGNYPDYSSDFNLSVNVGGCVIDTSWLSDNIIPTISFQSGIDPFYPYNSGYYFPFHFATDLILPVHGAQLIGEYQNDIGNDQQWNDAQELIYAFSNTTTDKAIANSAILGHSFYQSVYPFLTPTNTNGYYEGIIIDWWDPEAPSPNGTPWNELPHPNSGTFHDYALLFNEGMSAEKARLNIDSLFNYFIPRACYTLALNCLFSNDSTPVSILQSDTDPSIKISPNPTSNLIVIDAKETRIDGIFIYDTKGTLLRKHALINSTRKELRMDHLQPGLYFIKLRLGEKIITRKIIIQ